MSVLKLGEGLMIMENVLSSDECENLLSNCTGKVKSGYIGLHSNEFSNRVFEICKNSIRKLLEIGLDSEEIYSKNIPIGITPDWLLIKNIVSWSFNQKINDKGQIMKVFIPMSERLFESIQIEDGKKKLINIRNFGRGDILVSILNRYKIVEKEEKGIFLVGHVLFEKNKEYERKVAERYTSIENNVMIDEEEAENLKQCIELNISGKSFVIPIFQIRKFPQSILNLLIDTPMTHGMELNQKGERIFSFPTQSSVIFERFILPIIQQDSYLDIPVELKHSQQLEINNEFKYWGFLSPYDRESISKDAKYSNPHFPITSPELSLISNALHYNLSKEMKSIELKLSIMKAMENIHHKILHNFSHPQNNLKSLNRMEINKIVKKIAENLDQKFECIPFENFYDDNFFLMGNDRELYETCCSLFGMKSISFSHLNFIVDHHSMDSNNNSTTFSTKFTSNAKYDDIMSNIEWIIHLKTSEFETAQELEDYFSSCGIILQSSIVKSIGKHEQFWKGSGVHNDEYFPDYSLFKLSVLLIDVKSLQNKYTKLEPINRC